MGDDFLRCSLGRENFLNDHDVVSRQPTEVRPELASGLVVRVNENTAARNAFSFQRDEAGLDQRATDALFLETDIDREVMQIASPTVVATHHRANNLPLHFDNGTEAGITVEEFGDAFARVAVAQAHAFTA